MPQLCYYYLFIFENNLKLLLHFKLTNIISTAWSVNCEVPEQSGVKNPSGKFFLYYYWTFKNTKFNSQFIYIYICFYLCRQHRETIHRETRCAFCRLMQSPWNGASQQWTGYFIKRTNQKIPIFNYLVGMKRCISLLKSASHSATLSFQPTLTEKKSLVY